MHDRRRDPLRDDRIRRVEAEIGKRMRRFCADFPESVFNDLVHRAAEIDVKYTMRRDIRALGGCGPTSLS